MTVESAAASKDLANPQRLAAMLRSCTSKMTESANGGVALLFLAKPGDSSPENPARLRAAAGFPRAESARDAAEVLRGCVSEVIADGAERTLPAPPALGDRAKGGLMLAPIDFEGSRHGVLVVGSPSPIEESLRESIVREASQLALRLDHAHLRADLKAMKLKLERQEENEDSEENEEVLKLSEALFAQDIELLRNNEKLEKIEKLKNDFIEKMSRELRTPLNSIIEAIISVLTGENEMLSEGSKTSLRSALDHGTQFLRTLQNILDLWRIKQHELPLEIQVVNFHEVIDEAIFSIQDGISDKPLAIEHHVEEPFPKIQADLTKINQILFLLLENAAKFTARGQITITAKLDEGQLYCEVRDTGIGICPDDQPFIFDEFFQVDEPSSQTYSGAGLGLTLVRDLVVLLDGEVSVDSDIGRGTAISFQIPVQTAG